ncbi:MAG: FAD-binding domain-containing protein [Chitinophagaceae bacterium]
MNQPVFITGYAEILQRLDAIDPVQYGKTRNFADGAVTYLSPYISRGVITLPQVAKIILAKDYKPYQVQKLLQELAWREFFQRVWWHHGDRLFDDLKYPQQQVLHHEMIAAVSNAATGIDAIDLHIKNLYQTGYMHNHVRMYAAGITCNLGRAYWLQPSRWMYYHLLDGDLASNTCSWQWVAGTFSSKKYIANQENINRYLYSNQQHTIADHSYETIFDQPLPGVLQQTTELHLTTPLPETAAAFRLNEALPLHVYTTYWLNPEWRKDEPANRVLLLEPSHFEKFPVSKKVIDFCMRLASDNIPGIQIFVGEFESLMQRYGGETIVSLQHPLHEHFTGTKDPYPWMFPQVTGYSGSFFSFWKKCEKYLKQEPLANSIG